MAIKSSDQISIVDLTDGYSVMLTNDSFTFEEAEEIIRKNFTYSKNLEATLSKIPKEGFSSIDSDLNEVTTFNPASIA